MVISSKYIYDRLLEHLEGFTTRYGMSVILVDLEAGKGGYNGMKETVRTPAVCPKCGTVYHDRPAISGVDNSTLVCPDCGTREALMTLGIDEAEQEQIIQVIHRCRTEV